MGQENKKLISTNESNVIWQIKAIAILLTICAHCNTVPENASIGAKTVSVFISSLGSLGVPIFFFYSGYLFTYKPINVFIRSKIKALIIPWAFCGTMVYLYVYLRKSYLSLYSYVEWILGIDTYLWYLSVYVALIIIGQFLYYVWRKTKISIEYTGVVFIIISVVILILENAEIIRFHPYLDIFRWQWIFIAGMISRQKISMGMILKSRTPFIIVLLMVYMLALDGKEMYYWHPFWGPTAFITIITLTMFCKNVDKHCSLLVDIGKKSFSIYLLHMPVAGIVVNLLNRVSDMGGIVTFFIPIMVLVITYLFINLVIRFISDKKFEPYARQLLGIR